MKYSIHASPYVVGLTGGVAAGKSEVRKTFEALAVPCLDADVVARNIHQDPLHPATQELACAFPEWMSNEGALKRGSLQGLFARNGEANRTLIEILKPHVLAAVRDWIKHQVALYVICESALLTSEPMTVDKLILVESQTPLRIQRMRLRNPQWSEDDMNTLIRVQAKMQRSQIAEADIIRNDGSLEALQQQVVKLHHNYQTLWN
ncbi:MAG: dephospho-CoA kinase [Burkholderiales bacterium PBB4]|nr:MAG: dephospho-CoA kinase [Burkholderiales bacterium PBB4]